ncbi:MAG: class I SAM-dependent RNA methyltransferase [Acidobacteria bacterium]|nr:class I SAM-dependent RNA methyltransferase [Acidobacteriota bacterium]
MEKLVYGGDGLSRSSGHVVFTPYVLPGERVSVTVTERKAQHVRAALDDVLTPSPHRATPPCAHFTHCGGCHYQHTTYENQVALKVEILKETLQRVGRITPPDHIDTITGPPLAYRNRAQFHMDHRGIGYHEEGSRTVQPITRCEIISPKLLHVFERLRGMRGDRRWPNFLRTLEVFTNETEVQLNVLNASQPIAKRFFGWCAEEIPVLASSSLTYAAAGFDFRVSHDSFFQVNRFLIDPLVNAALEGAETGRALDLYSGVGLLALPLAKRGAQVTAVENGRAAWHDLQFNAQTAGVSLEGLQASAEDYLATAEGPFDFVLADPPRAGLGKKVVARLLALKPRLLTIVSCDPATLARDLAALVPTYAIEKLTMVDLFPQTYHLETIVRLRSE